MKILLLRHGIAEDRRRALPDAERALTKTGRRRIARIAEQFDRIGLRFARVYCSPLRRARETAEIVCRKMRRAPGLLEHAGLAPGGAVAELLDELNRELRRDAATVLLVGHEPDLSRLVATLIAGTPTVALDWRKGGVCLIEVPPGKLRYARCAELRWFVPPKLLRKL
ncbi:MAG: phosphohistidine phosphatase SixA [Steroidobacteraceae bacterium]|nr:phosphohistidine phosphatase SixA [Steroidobacteraceae bacterium]MDW8259397.1 phosphohistidine phosphatase SixA [Gammaproteobacteria bacterium]